MAVPLAGTAWAPQPTHRLLLSIEDSERHAHIIKSTWLPPQHAKYTIAQCGVTATPELEEPPVT